MTSTLTVTPEECLLESRPPWIGDFFSEHTPLYIGGTDPGLDPDDEVAQLAARGLNSKSRGAILLLGVVANHQPAEDRAALVRGTHFILNRAATPVVVGGETPGHNDSVATLPNYQFRCEYATKDGLMHDTATHMMHTCEMSMPGSLRMLGLSRFTDFAQFLAQHGKVAQRALNRIVIMGGIEVENNALKLVDGLFVPDSAANNKYDMEAAKRFYRLAQELGIPLTVLTRHAAGVCQVPRWVYDELAERSPVGKRLQDIQRDSIEVLWRKANMPPGVPERKGLPDRCDKAWFCKTFLGGQGDDRAGTDSIWDLVLGFNLYDPLTVLAAVDRVRQEFMDPYEIDIAAPFHASGQATPVRHQIIGLSPQKTGITNPREMVKFLIATMFAAIEPAA